jgi:hypothetical protein
LAATLPSEAEAGLAKEISRLLASPLKKGAPMKLRILDDDAGQATVKLLATAVGLLLLTLEPSFGRHGPVLAASAYRVLRINGSENWVEVSSGTSRNIFDHLLGND